MPRNDVATVPGSAPTSWDELITALGDDLLRRETLIAAILDDDPEVAAAAVATWRSTPLPVSLDPADPTTRERVQRIQAAMSEQETRLATALSTVEQELQRVAQQNRTSSPRNVSDIQAGGFEARA